MRKIIKSVVQYDWLESSNQLQQLKIDKGYKKMTLKELQIGKSAVIKSVGSHGALRQHFLDMGMIPGVEITVVKLAPMGDLWKYRFMGMN